MDKYIKGSKSLYVLLHSDMENKLKECRLTVRHASSWYLYKMVAQKMVRKYEVKQVCSGKKIGFDDSFDVTNCLQQIKILDLLHMCLPCSDLPSNLSSMCQLVYVQYRTLKVKYPLIIICFNKVLNIKDRAFFIQFEEICDD